MSLELLLEEFDKIIQTPADVERLNQSILQWAIMGRLLPQDPNDETAEVLLNRIKVEMKALVEAGKIRSTKELAPIELMSVPFPLPIGWSWCRVGQVCTIRGGKRVPKGYRLLDDPTDYIYIRVTDMKNGTIEDNGLKYISAEIQEQIDAYIIEKNDLYITIAGTIGDVGDVPAKFHRMNLTENAARITPHLINKEYLKIVLNSPAIQDQFAEKVNQMAQPKLALTRIRTTLLPLPPLSEQERITAEMNKLFKQTRELAIFLDTAESQRKKFHTSAIHRLTEAKTPKETRAAWHLIRDNFDRLYTEPETIDELKQAILQLAVMGRLVPQDPNDEPADVLLEQIAVERDDLIQQGHLKYRKAVPQIYGNDIPYPLPDGWLWVKLDQIASVVEYGTSQKSSLDSSGVPIIGMKSIQNGEVLLEGLKYVPSSINDLPRLYLKKFDLLFNRTNSYELVGKTGIFIGESKRYTLASYLIRISLFREFVNPHYINTYFNSLVCRVTQIEPEITQQTGQANFNGTKLRNVLIPLPPLQEQNRILAGVDKLFKQARELDTRLVTAESQRLTLLDAILSTW